MSMQRSTVVGVFRDRASADRAVEELHRIGVRDDQIGFVMRGEGEEGTSDGDAHNRAGEAATGGMLTGGLVGGAIAAAALFIPGVGPILAAGVASTILGGAAAGGAIGGLLGMLTGSGIPDDEARYYEGEFNQGRILVTVNADGRYQEVRDLLRRNGAYDVDQGEDAVSGTRETVARTNDDRESMRLHEERLQARTESVQAGEVTVGKDIVTERQQMEVPVTREEVHIERHPIEGRPTTGDIREHEEISVPVHEEQVHVEKQPVAYEEVEISKRQVQDTEHVTGEVRREEPRIEHQGDVPVHSGGIGISDWSEVAPEYHQRWQSQFGSQGGRWEDHELASRYGYEMAADPRFQNRDWMQAEPELRREYSGWATRKGFRADETAWDRFKDTIRDSWDSGRSRRRAA